MKRLSLLGLSILAIGGFAIITASTSHASGNDGLYLVGQISDTKTDGAFPANITLKDPVTGHILHSGKTLVDIQNGNYKAHLKDSELPAGNYQVELEGLDAAEDFSMAGFVNLQDTTPGTAQTGHLNISGYVLAGRIGLGTSPTLARVQVNETGAAQGVRSITNSGVAVYGQATAASGLASGGYFTSSSVGGRAMVGDALSTTGSTVGGLFYNRSVDGVGVWGRHINSSGNSIGVYGQTASPTGSAIVAENTNTGDIVRLGGAEGTILSDGTLPRHRYAASATATMVPIAYGYLGGTASFNSSGNFTVTSPSSGVYTIDIDGYTPNGFEVVVATAYESDGSQFASWANGDGADFQIRIWDVSTGLLTASDFTFVVYGAAGFNPPNLPARPKDSFKYGELNQWQAKDPQGFATWAKQVQAAEKTANAYTPSALPRDEAEPTPQTIRPVK